MSHSRLAASASSRWIRCPGSIPYIEMLKAEGKIPEYTTNDAARLGTAVHAIIEHCLLNGFHPELLSQSDIKKILKADKETKNIKITPKEIASSVICYDWTVKQARKSEELLAERRYDLSFVYDLDLGGTADISLLSSKLLHIGDYKNGRTHVHEENNSQMNIYALGAYHNENEWYNFKKYQTTIIQPNSTKSSLPIRSSAVRPIKDLLSWEEKTLIPAINLIARDSSTLVPGEVQCEWCDARHVCEARAKDSLSVAQTDFKHLASPKAELAKPQSLSREQLEFVLDNAERLRKFLNDCETYAYEVTEKEGHLGNYELQDKRGNRKLIEDKAAKKVIRANKLTIKELTVTADPKLMSVTQMETHLKNKGWEAPKIQNFMDEITERPITGKQLVKVDSTAIQDFKQKTKKRKLKKRKR